MIARAPLTVVYLALSVIGLVGTWWFNLAFMTGGGNYVAAWFANDASSSAAVDIIVAGIAACVLYVREGTRLSWSRVRIALLVVLSFVLAVAFTFPLFLALRELDLARRPTAEELDDTARR